ncbi:hypothetical protein, partial [Shewanella carassii]|uniref:hypothetical protein n=1 Tax=Shewanella carassii TaxID=1987584 RepID=UPI003570D4F0
MPSKSGADYTGFKLDCQPFLNGWQRSNKKATLRSPFYISSDLQLSDDLGYNTSTNCAATFTDSE